jgi:hypothetical protein
MNNHGNRNMQSFLEHLLEKATQCITTGTTYFVPKSTVFENCLLNVHGDFNPLSNPHSPITGNYFANLLSIICKIAFHSAFNNIPGMNPN